MALRATRQLSCLSIIHKNGVQKETFHTQLPSPSPKRDGLYRENNNLFLHQEIVFIASNFIRRDPICRTIQKRVIASTHATEMSCHWMLLLFSHKTVLIVDHVVLPLVENSHWLSLVEHCRVVDGSITFDKPLE